MTGRVVDSYTNIHSVKMFAHTSSERDYAKEAIEKARQTFQVEMRIFTRMDVGLTLINGFLIVAVVGWAIWLWSIDAASIGVVAIASSLVLRLNAMTGWIMWALTSFFRNLGVVAEGMETIAQPITLVDTEDATPLLDGKGEISFENLTHHYGRKTGGLDGVNLNVAPGQKIGLVGRSGAGKSTLVKLLLRFYDIESGRDQDRRIGHFQSHSGFAAGTYRNGAAGFFTSASLGPRQHSLWPPRCHRRDDDRSRQTGRSL